MKLAKKWRPAMRILVILTILVPYFSSLAVLLPQDAEAVTNEPQVIFNEENHGKVEASYVEKETTIEWTIDYQKYQDTSTNDDVQRLMKLRLEQVANGVGTVKNMNDSGLMEEDGWYVEKEFSAESKGTLIVEMPKDVLELTIEVQMDEQRTTIQEVETAVLAAETEEAAEEPEVQAEVQTEEISETAVLENVLPQQAAGPHQVAAEVAEEEPQPEVQPEVETAEPAEEVTQTSESTTASETEEETSEPTSPPVQRAIGRALLSPVTRAEVIDPFDYTTMSNPEGIFPVHSVDNYLTNNSTNPTGTSPNVKNYNYGESAPTTPTVIDDGTALGNVFKVPSSTTDMNFVNGYHSYKVSYQDDFKTNYSGDAFTKKTVSPTSDPNQFKVQLDMIGDTISPIPMIDVVLVLDKSGSMGSTTSIGNTRWTDLKAAVKQFTESILVPGRNIQVGMVGFGSDVTRDDKNNVTANIPWADTALFSNDSGFTNNPSAILGHSIYTTSPPNNQSDSYTPTFLGVDAGLDLLMSGPGARENAFKVLVTITDGLPTIVPTNSYFNSNNTSENLKTSLAKTTESRSTTNIKRTLINTSGPSGRTYYEIDGNSRNVQANINLINARFNETNYSGVVPYSVGYHLSGTPGTSAGRVLDALAKGVVPANRFSASDVSGLVAALEGITANLISTIANATVTDPMSDYVSLVTPNGSEPFQKSALKVHLKTEEIEAIPLTGGPGDPGYASRINVSVDPVKDDDENEIGTIINLSNVSLGGQFDKDGQLSYREGFRITYTVELKEEWRDGKFYPANGTTYLANGNGENLYFAIPSVRNNEMMDIPVQKIWVDDDNKWGTREDIVLQLQEKTDDTGTNADWSDVVGKIIDVDENMDTFEGIFKGVPLTKEGAIVDYRIVERVKVDNRYEERRVYGYADPVYEPETFQADIALPDDSGEEVTPEVTKPKVTNRLKYTGFSFTKVGHDETTPLGGVDFTLTRGGTSSTVGVARSDETTGVVAFSNLPVGEYTLGEDVPLGYKDFAGLEVTISQGDDGVLFVEELSEDEIVVNKLKPFDLSILKKSSVNNDELPNAVFELYGKYEDNVLKELLATATTDADGIGSFIKNDSSGDTFELEAGKTYYIKETQAPDGFILLDGIFKVDVDVDGSVNVKYIQEGSDDIELEVDAHLTEEGNNIIQFTIENDQKGQLPATGGPGRKSSMIAAAMLIVFATGTTVYYVYRNRKGGA